MEYHVINLPTSTERLKNALEQINSFDKEAEISIFQAGKFKIPGNDVWHSHYSLWKKLAISENEMAIIVEDDVKFVSDKSYDHFKNCLRALPEDWGMLLGCSYSNNTLTDHNELLDEVTSTFASLIFYAISKNAAKTLCEATEKFNGFPEFDQIRSVYAVDHWIKYKETLRQNPDMTKIRVFTPKKFFCKQLNGMSDRRKVVTDLDYLLGNKKFIA